MEVKFQTGVVVLFENPLTVFHQIVASVCVGLGPHFGEDLSEKSIDRVQHFALSGQSKDVEPEFV